MWYHWKGNTLTSTVLKELGLVAVGITMATVLKVSPYLWPLVANDTW